MVALIDPAICSGKYGTKNSPNVTLVLNTADREPDYL